MKKERWFKCYPGKWLQALGGLSATQGYLYIVICYRIYDEDGPCRDSIQRLAQRCGIRLDRAQAALDDLIEMGKLQLVDGGLMNAVAAELIDERERFSEKQRKCASARWPSTLSSNEDKLGQKSEGKQRSENASAMPSASISILTSSDSQLSKDSQLSLYPPESQNLTESHSGRHRRTRARQQMPENWEPDERGVLYARDLGFTEAVIRNLVVACRDYHLKHGTLIAGSVGLAATWRTWCNNEIKFNNRSRDNGYGRPRALQDDSKSISRAAERMLKHIEDGGEYVIPPRPTLFGRKNPPDLQLLPKGRSSQS